MPISVDRDCAAAISCVRFLRASPAGSPGGPRLFLHLDNKFGLFQPRRQPGVLFAEGLVLRLQRMLDGGLSAAVKRRRVGLATISASGGTLPPGWDEAALTRDSSMGLAVVR